MLYNFLRTFSKERKKRAQVKAVVFAVTWIFLLLAAMFALSIWAETFHSNPQIQSIASVSWSGYLIASSFDHPQPEVFQVSASWVVPDVNASAGNGYSSAWIGIGGQFDKTLIQVGTEHNFVNEKKVYDAWYELLPDYAVKVNKLSISAGDQITASISLINSDTNQWNIQLTDITTGQSFNQNFIYNSTRLSAEWMVERPTVNNQISSLAGFGTITFADCTLNLNGVVAAIGNFSYSQIRMANDAGAQLTDISPVNFDGSSFSVSYLASG